MASTDEMKATDYYKILGVDTSADVAALKNAYQTLSQQYDPERNPGNKTIASKFREITFAYNLLSDPEKRVLYEGYRGGLFPGITLEELINEAEPEPLNDEMNETAQTPPSITLYAELKDPDARAEFHATYFKASSKEQKVIIEAQRLKDLSALQKNIAILLEDKDHQDMISQSILITIDNDTRTEYENRLIHCDYVKLTRHQQSDFIAMIANKSHDERDILLEEQPIASLLAMQQTKSEVDELLKNQIAEKIIYKQKLEEQRRIQLQDALFNSVDELCKSLNIPIVRDNFFTDGKIADRPFVIRHDDKDDYDHVIVFCNKHEKAFHIANDKDKFIALITTQEKHYQEAKKAREELQQKKAAQEKQRRHARSYPTNPHGFKMKR